MNAEELDRLLNLARELAPRVEAAVSEVKDCEIRGFIAGALMQRILGTTGAAEAPGGETRSSASSPAAAAAEAAKGKGTQGRILDLRADGFFAEPRQIDQVMDELKIRGYHHNKSDLRMSLLRLARKRILRRIPFGQGKQQTFYYVNP